MYKIIASLLLLFVISLSAEEKSYTFEAKGEFAEELKALVEKYSQDGKVDVTVHETQKKKSKSTTQSILSVFVSDDAEALKYADVDEGRTIYQNSCVACHGVNADENSYSVAHKLAELKPLEIVDLLKGYKENYDGDFGGSLRTIMKPQADKLTSEEMQSIAVYIYSIKNGDKTPITTNEEPEEENSDEVKSSYLQ